MDIHPDIYQRNQETSRKALQLAAADHRVNARKDDIYVAELGSNLSPACFALHDLGAWVNTPDDALCNIDLGDAEFNVPLGCTIETIRLVSSMMSGSMSRKLPRPTWASCWARWEPPPQTNKSGSRAIQHDHEVCPKERLTFQIQFLNH